MSHTKSINEILKTMTLFNNVSDEHIEKVLNNVIEKTFLPNQTIFLDGSEEGVIYLISSGKIKISKLSKYNIESVLGILHPGDFFGELEMIDGLPRSATASALAESKVYIINKNDFDYLINNSQNFAHNILNTLAMRLRTINETFIRDLERHSEWTNSRILKLHQLIEATQIVNSSLDLDKVLTLILSIATKTVDADRGTLYLIDANKKELWSKILEGNGLLEIRLPFGKGIAGRVAETGETVNISDAYKDVRFNPDIDKVSGYHTESILCMPMKNKNGNIVGVFQLLNKRKETFTKEDEEYINAFSVHAAIAVENANLAQQMAQNESLSAVGRMASTIVHDIKNPMGTIRLSAQVIKMKSANEDTARLAEGIIKQIDRFVSMTQEILDFSRGVSVTNIQEVEIENLIEEIIYLIEKDSSKRNIKIEKNISYGGKCFMDPDKMVRVFYNIAGNAADAMPDGGKLSINISKIDEKINFEFKDTGIGMSEEVKSKIFKVFFTHGKQHGTGLGMAIVKKIVEDHRGNIEVESELGKGTTIRIVIPKTQI